MKNLENNKLIAEFIGMQETDIGWYDFEEALNNPYSNTFDCLCFDTSWDWLMPVIATIYDSSHADVNNNLIGDITHALLDVNIDATYEAVVKFIKWYNKNKSR